MSAEAGGQMSMATQNILSSAGRAIVSSGLETDGGWNNIGFDNDSWSQHLTAGVSAGLTAGISGSGQNGGFGGNMRSDILGQMVQQGISTAAIKLSGGKGFSDDYLAANKNFNWNSMAPDASKLGSMVGGMAGEYLKTSYANYNQKREAEKNSPQLPHQNDPLGTVETLLGGLWYGMNTAKDYAKGIMSDISKFGGDMINDFGLNDEIDAITGTVTGAYNTAAGYVNSFADITRGMVEDLDAGVSEFADSTGNWFTEGHFATDEELPEILAQERLQDALRNGTALQEGSAEYNRMKAVLDKKISNGADADSQLRADEKLASYKNNKDVDSSLKNLTDLAQQNGGGSEYVREELKKALSKIPGGDKLNIDKIIETSCVSLSVWVALKQAGANVGEYGEFYAEQVKKGNIKAENAAVSKINDLANSYTIDGKKPEIGFIRDVNKYENLLKSGEVTNGVVLFEKSKEKYHAINVYASNEGTKISDVSYRTHGKFASEYTNAKKGNFRWLFYVKKGRR